jgi:hypothetical protein
LPSDPLALLKLAVRSPALAPRERRGVAVTGGTKPRAAAKARGRRFLPVIAISNSG